MRESLRDSLARIPDLGEEEPEVLIGAALAAKEAPAPGSAFEEQLAGVYSAQDASPEPELSPTATPSPEWLAPRKKPLWRRILFGVVLVGLIASIPVLAFAGYQLIQDSTAGDYNTKSLRPTDPGYEAQVDPTPTAVAIQFDDAGKPNGLTFVSLAGSDGGGGVVFVPLNTQVSEPSFGVNTLRGAYDAVANRPAMARERLASQVGRLLNVGVGEIIDLGANGWEQLVAPVAPLTIDSPDQVTLPDGTVIPTGTTQLTAAQVGPYLAATTGPGESDLARLNRHQVVWKAWLDAVAKSGKDDAVPGESSAGIGKFARALAQGKVSYDTLPVDPSNKTPGLYVANKSAVNDLMTDIVPSPTGATPGGRFTVRLLNGVQAGPVDAKLVREIVHRGGSVSIVGNGPEFGSEETEIVYANPAKKQLATVMAAALGAKGKVRLDREAPDTVDLTIVVGKDLQGD
ncbi:MAG: LytR C-terminal domain-containing protein [Acidimicrobiales bacterium]